MQAFIALFNFRRLLMELVLAYSTWYRLLMKCKLQPRHIDTQSHLLLMVILTAKLCSSIEIQRDVVLNVSNKS